jgi:hypothetical protein
MSGEDTRDRRGDEAPQAQRLSTSRLFLIVVVFLGLAAYSIWNSDRFQTLFQGVSEQRLSELLERRVTFRQVDFQVFPPSVHLADVRVGNDPRLPDGPLLQAEELTIGGGFSVTGGELRFGRVRALHPRVALVQFPDGTWNLPPGLTRSAGKGGLSLKIGELVIQQGVFEFAGRKTGVDGRLVGFATELVSLPGNRYRGTLICRKATLHMPGTEPLEFGIDLAFRAGAESGVQVDAMRVNGEFGELRMSGSVDDLKNPTILLRASGDLHVAEVERLFHSALGFAGDARLQAQLHVPPSGGFRMTGHLSVARLDAKGFPIEAFEAAVLARPEALLARIEKARYAGGDVSGLLRIENIAAKGRPQPMTLQLNGKGISIERFFGDLKLPGTGLSGSAALSAALRWGEGGIEHANGAAKLSIEPGSGVSIVKGRFGIPIGGGGDLTVADGRIGFEGTTFRFPRSMIEMTGGLRIGRWMPDFDFHMRSRDLAEMDHLFQNFVAASGNRPNPLGLAGSGEVEGHLADSWSNPEATTRFTAESARYGGVLFGSVRGAADMHDGAFIFHPLRVYDGSATLSLEGTTRFRKDPVRPTLDVTVTAREYPVSRFLEFLDLKLPIEGRVTGSFPLTGNPPDGVSGGGVAALDDAVLWGQKVARITGRMALSPSHFELDDARADIGGGMVGGRLAIAYRAKTFEVRLAGDAIPLEALDPLARLSADVSGLLSFDLAGSGSIDQPDLTGSASLSGATFFGHPIPAAMEPHLVLAVTHGDVDASVSAADRWSLKARGSLARPLTLDVALDVRDLGALMLLTPATLPAGDGGALAATGRIQIPFGEGENPSGTFIVTEARLDARDRPGLLRTSGDVRISLEGKRVTVGDVTAVGDGVDLKLHGTLDFSGDKATVEAKMAGTADATLLALALPDLGLTGRLSADLSVSGPIDSPAWNGSARIENGRYRMAGYSFEDIEGSARLIGSTGEIEGLRARVGEGEMFLGGTFHVAGSRIRDFRLTAQAHSVAVRAIPALRLTVDADLVLAGDEAGNQVRGEITLLRGTYSKDVEVTLTDLLARSRPSGAVIAIDPWKERTTLDVRIVSAASLEVRNNLARLSGTVDLRARGTLADPVLLGQVILDEGGRVVFSDVRYEIEAGTLTFSNTARIAPFVDVRARAEVKGYNLIVLLAGTWPRIAANFTSDPPLSDDAILGLLLTGTAPDSRQPTDTANQLVSAAGGAISGAVTGGIQKQTGNLFKLDRFQIEPVFTGGQLTTVRSTLGKQITQDLSVTTSIALDSSKDPIIRVEWQASNTILVQLIRDDNGILSISFRRRLRL